MTITHESLRRQIILCMNSRSWEYDFTRLIGWMMIAVNDGQRGQLAGLWNLCMDEIASQWFEKGFKNWVAFLDNNFSVYVSTLQEMKTNHKLYEATWNF